MADINLLFCCKRPEEAAKGVIGYQGGEGQEDFALVPTNADGQNPTEAKMIQQFMAGMKDNKGMNYSLALI